MAASILSGVLISPDRQPSGSEPGPIAGLPPLPGLNDIAMSDLDAWLPTQNNGGPQPGNAEHTVCNAAVPASSSPRRRRLPRGMDCSVHSGDVDGKKQRTGGESAFSTLPVAVANPLGSNENRTPADLLLDSTRGASRSVENPGLDMADLFLKLD